MVLLSGKVFFLVQQYDDGTAPVIFINQVLISKVGEILPLNLTLYFYNIKSFQMKNL